MYSNSCGRSSLRRHPLFEGKSIRHVAFDYELWQKCDRSGEVTNGCLLRWLSRFKYLKTVTFVLEDQGDSQDEVRFVDLERVKDLELKTLYGEEMMKGEDTLSLSRDMVKELRKSYEKILAEA